MEKRLSVEGMSCDGCESTITRALGKLDGVMVAHADHQAKEVTVTFDPQAVDLDQIAGRIEELGFSVTG